MALDHGTRRTGVAVCDPTETIVRPLTVVRDAGTQAGLDQIARLVQETEAELVVVGLPVSLSGEEHGQAAAARAFLEELRPRLDIPLTTYDERYTTKVAGARGGSQPLDARAAAVLLEDYLTSRHIRPEEPSRS
jgi:putative holliday junction resolvase